MTHKHNFIFKTVTCLIMASAIFVLTSFVLPDTNVVEAKQLSCISYETPAPSNDTEVEDGTYYEYYDEVLGTTTYFCYLSN